MSAIESLASGTPVVANRVGGVPDVVRDGVDGFLVEPGDVDGAAERLAVLAEDERAADALGESGERVCSSATRSRGSSTTSTGCTRSLLAAKGL